MSDIFDDIFSPIVLQPKLQRKIPKRGIPVPTKDRQVDGPFLLGPIALSWLTPALKLSKPAIKTALALCYQVGLEEGRLVFSVNQSRFQNFALSRFDMRKGLKALETAGLIAIVQSGRGRKFKIQILKYGRKSEATP